MKRCATGDRHHRHQPPPGGGRDLQVHPAEQDARTGAERREECEPRRKPLPVEISFMNEGAGWKLAH